MIKPFRVRESLLVTGSEMSALAVRLGEMEVGVLESFEVESQRFTFSQAYRSVPISSRPVLGQIFEARCPHSIKVDGPICWFAHLLPQGEMLRWRSRLLGIDEDDTFGLLRELGVNMQGPVVLAPTEPTLPIKSTQLPTPTAETPFWLPRMTSFPHCTIIRPARNNWP